MKFGKKTFSVALDFAYIPSRIGDNQTLVFSKIIISHAAELLQGDAPPNSSRILSATD